MTQAQRDMDEAVEEWLDAHLGHERYLVATERLYAVFAHAWRGSRRNFAEAFTDFREAIFRDSGNKHTEVTVVIPTRRLESI